MTVKNCHRYNHKSAPFLPERNKFAKCTMSAKEISVDEKEPAGKFCETKLDCKPKAY
ncbi:MAG: hypothetical protein IJD23_09660 [Spirochaetaceae bacterium]|nr:hypothetical protein [Spirochaetaceae bacterium]